MEITRGSRVDLSARGIPTKTETVSVCPVDGLRHRIDCASNLIRAILWSRHEDFQSSCRSGTMCHIGRYWYLFKRLTAVFAGRSYRFEFIVAYSSGKVVAK